MEFTKLSNLVDDEFTVKGVGAYYFKKWDNATKQFVTSPSYEKGYRKLYPVETDKGTMDLGPGQLGNLLEAVFSNGKADLVNRTFLVKSNMTKEQFANASQEEKMKVRYYFNPVKTHVVAEEEPLPEDPGFY